MRFTSHLAAALVVAFQGRDASAADPASMSGAWKKRELTFTQMGFSTTYSCSGLASKLKLLLRASGARDDVTVAPLGCGQPGAPSSVARAHLVFHVLAPDARGKKTGTWRSVAIVPRAPTELEAGDCELVERFRDELLPLLVTRNRVDRVRCVPYQANSTIDLRFEVFTAAPGTP